MSYTPLLFDLFGFWTLHQSLQFRYKEPPNHHTIDDIIDTIPDFIFTFLFFLYMTKQLIAGLATIVVAGSALIATGMYAATGTSSTGTLSPRTQ